MSSKRIFVFPHTLLLLASYTVSNKNKKHNLVNKLNAFLSTKKKKFEPNERCLTILSEKAAVYSCSVHVCCQARSTDRGSREAERLRGGS